MYAALMTTKTLAIFALFAGACGAKVPAEQPSTQAAVTSDPEWCHAYLTAQSGVTAHFDYQHGYKDTQAGSGEGDSEGGFLQYAYNVWVNASGDALDPTLPTQAVVLVESYAGACGQSCEQYATVAHQYIVDMAYEDGHFTASVPHDLETFSVPVDTDGSDTTAYFWELAIVNGSTWYKDASTGNNMRFAPNDSTTSCPNSTE
jgi:hypothetical protein